MLQKNVFRYYAYMTGIPITISLIASIASIFVPNVNNKVMNIEQLNNELSNYVNQELKKEHLTTRIIYSGNQVIPLEMALIDIEKMKSNKYRGDVVYA